MGSVAAVTEAIGEGRVAGSRAPRRVEHGHRARLEPEGDLPAFEPGVGVTPSRPAPWCHRLSPAGSVSEIAPVCRGDDRHGPTPKVRHVREGSGAGVSTRYED